MGLQGYASPHAPSEVRRLVPDCTSQRRLTSRPRFVRKCIGPSVSWLDDRARHRSAFPTLSLALLIVAQIATGAWAAALAQHVGRGDPG